MDGVKKGERDIADTIRTLMQLDKQSLLLIDSGARLLAARQDMDRDFQDAWAKETT